MISQHFSMKEVIYSAQAEANNIDNTLPDIYYRNAQGVANFILEPIRLRFEIPFSPLSWFRCPKLNALVGGVDTSDHLYALATDIMIDGVTLLELFEFIQKKLIFKQLILEAQFDLIHVSFDKSNNKQETLKMIMENGKKHYIPFKID